MSKMRPIGKQQTAWYARSVDPVTWLVGFVAALALFLHNIDDIGGFIERTLGIGDAHLELINQNAQMATDSTFAQIFVESRAAFLAIPVENRYYAVTFFIKKTPNVALKDCNVIVDSDNMNPLVKHGRLGTYQQVNLVTL